MTNISKTNIKSVPPLHPFIDLAITIGMVSMPLIALAHERWVTHYITSPVNMAYFQSFSGTVLFTTILATLFIFFAICFRYLVCPRIIQQTSSNKNIIQKSIQFLLDQKIHNYFYKIGFKISILIFAKIAPAFVLILGAINNWLIMPSYPLSGNLSIIFRIAQVILAIWILSGKYLKYLGIILFLIFFYICFAYGIILAVDILPVLASACYYFFSDKNSKIINFNQIWGIRISIGVGFFFLGLINKIYIAYLAIGVSDHFPNLMKVSQAIIPGLSREGFSLHAALVEMVLGIFIFLGIFDRITTIVLSLIFTFFIAVFGWVEIIHIYPISAFIILFFLGESPELLGGHIITLERYLNIKFKLFTAKRARLASVLIISTSSALLLLFLPMYLITEVIPKIHF